MAIAACHELSTGNYLTSEDRHGGLKKLGLLGLRGPLAANAGILVGSLA